MRAAWTPHSAGCAPRPSAASPRPYPKDNRAPERKQKDELNSVLHASRDWEQASLMSRKRLLLLVAGGAVATLVIFGALTGGRAWWAWRSIERVEFDPVAARNAIPFPDPETDAESLDIDPATVAAATTADSIEYEVVLVIGSDERMERVTANQDVAFADVIMLYLSPSNGDPPILVSLPRDLLTRDRCSGGTTTLANTLVGCGGLASGVNLVALAVEDFTGIAVDHLALVNFDALVGAVDAVGGVTLCVEYAQREQTVELLPEGCSLADGATALAWIRSRQTQEYVDGEWRFVEGVGDLARIERQQSLLFALLAKLKSMRSPTTLTAVVTDLGDAVRLDKGFSMTEAIDMAWDLRGTPTSQIRRLTVPVVAEITEDGTFVVRPTMSFAELLEIG